MENIPCISIYHQTTMPPHEDSYAYFRVDGNVKGLCGGDIAYTPAELETKIASLLHMNPHLRIWNNVPFVDTQARVVSLTVDCGEGFTQTYRVLKEEEIPPAIVPYLGR